MRERSLRSPELVPEKLVLHRHRNAIEGGELVRRAIEHAFGARAVVAADIDDQGVVELAEVLDGLDDAADFMVGVGEIGAINIRLLDEELLLFKTERIPLRQFLRPRRQLGVLGHDAQPLLVGEDLLAHLVPALVEEVHVADLLDPLRRGMMRRMGGARHIIDEPGLARRDLLELLDVPDGLIRHRRLHVPAGIVQERIDGRRVAEQVRLPLAGVAADEAVKIFEAHSIRPLLERAGLARLVRGRVVVLAEPRGCVPIRFQDCADGALVDRDDRVVTREPRRHFSDHPEANRVMIAARDQCRPRRRTQ